MNIIMVHKEDYQTEAVVVLLINNLSKLTSTYLYINLTCNEKSFLWVLINSTFLCSLSQARFTVYVSSLYIKCEHKCSIG